MQIVEFNDYAALKSLKFKRATKLRLETVEFAPDCGCR